MDTARAFAKSEKLMRSHAQRCYRLDVCAVVKRDSPETDSGGESDESHVERAGG